jgi:hypothetical protein
MLHAITAVEQNAQRAPNRIGSNFKIVGILSLYFAYFSLRSTVAHASPPALGGPSTVVTGLSYPQSIAVDGNGNLYIGDQGCVNFVGAQGDCNVYKETFSNGTYTPSVIASFSAANAPQGIAIDSSGKHIRSEYRIQPGSEDPSSTR